MKKKYTFLKFIFSPFNTVYKYLILYMEKLSENTNLKRLNNWALGFLFLDFILSILKSRFKYLYIQGIHEHKTLGNIAEVIQEPAVVFIQHFWIELFGGILIFIALEDKLEDISLIPKKVRDFNHTDLLKRIRDHAFSQVLILDTSIHSFIDGDNRAFKSTFQKLLKRNVSVRILLLHPDTYAAEQRSKDLTRDTRAFMENMKKGLFMLHTFMESVDDEHKGKIEVRLYKTTPPMIYTSWDDHVRFAMLHPNNLADERDNFIARERSPLIRSFRKYFKELWQEYEKKNGKVVLLDDYLFVNIISGGQPISKLYWGGNTESHELPRFLANYPSQNTLKKLNEICSNNHKVQLQIEHDQSKSSAYVHKISDPNENGKKYYAITQIRKTYGNKIDDFDLEVFEIKYVDDNFISLIDKSLVKEKIAQKGYAFVSHTQYDIILSLIFKNVFDALLESYSQDLVEDKYDRDFIKEVKTKHPGEYNANPRKRLMEIFDCNISNGVVSVNPVNSEVYGCNYKLTFEDVTHDGPHREFTTVSKLLNEARKKIDEITQAGGRPIDELESYQSRADRLSTLEDFLLSTIKANITYLVGHQFITQGTEDFRVYIHLIRSWVSADGNSSNISNPTPYNNEVADFEYKVIHLIRRENITGGVNNIRIATDEGIKEDSLLLQAPLDSVFFKKFIKVNHKKCLIENVVSPIQIEPKDNSGQNSPKLSEKENERGDEEQAFRDVLVVEYFRKP